MGIRPKIMLGFIILASMLFISGAISAYELTKLGKSIKGLIFDNFRSIDYSRNMLDALDKQNNALLTFAQGDSAVAVRQFREAQEFFWSNLDSARTYFHLDVEIVAIDSVRLRYEQFIAVAQSALKSSSYTLTQHLNEVSPLVLEASKHVKNLITVNQQSLFRSASLLETSAQRASVPGLIVIVTSLIFTFVFTYLVHHFFVSPILRLTKGVNDYVKFRKPFEVPLETRDELFSLKESIANLIAILKTSSKKPD